MRSSSPRTAVAVARLALHRFEDRDVPSFYGNQLFPDDNPWNQTVAAAPVAANSDAIIARMVSRHGGTAPQLHADFGNPANGALYGIPVNVVDGSTAKVTVAVPSFGYPGESDLVQVPIPANAVIEGDGPTGPAPPGQRGDSHMIVYDKSANVVYEMFQAVRPNETSFPYGGVHPTGQWGAYQISFWDLNQNSFRTVGWTSADAAGLPILPGLVRPDEARPVSVGGQGVIDHAIRVSVQQTRNSYAFPASHFASSLTASDLPRMGERFRLKASFVIPPTWAPEARAIAQAMKDYGLIVADNGSDLYFQGSPSSQWNMASVLQVQQIAATSFEVVDLAPAVTGLSVASGPTTGGSTVTVSGRGFSGAAGQLHVLFGGTEATVTVVSDTQLVAIAPAHAAGVVDVRVQSGTTKTNSSGKSVFFGYGTSPVTLADQFTYTGNTPPTVSDIADRSVASGGTTGAIAFVVGDAETPAGSLSVVGTSSNPALVPASGIAVGGSGANRTVTVTPAAGQSGAATITVTVTDAGGLTASDTFVLTVTPAGGSAFTDDFSSASPSSAWSLVGGSWVQTNGVLRQTSAAPGDPFKAIVTDRTWSPAQEITASVRVDSWVNGTWPRAGVGVRTDATGRGYNLVFRGGNQVQFLNDGIAWGNAFPFTWQTGTWYRFKLRAESDGTLRGKVWAVGQAEPTGWMFTQAGWTGRTGGSPAVNGGSNGDGSSTVSFDDVTADAVVANPLFSDDFSGSSLGSGWTVGAGTWAQVGGALSQTGTQNANEKKAMVTGVAAGAASEIEARVRVDSWTAGPYARAGVGLGTDAAGRGYNLVVRDGNQVQFLNDGVAWGNSFAFNWQPGTWYRFKLRQEADGTLRAKVWADGQIEPTSWMFTQTGWGYRAGWASLNGGSALTGQGNSTASFDDVRLWA